MISFRKLLQDHIMSLIQLWVGQYVGLIDDHLHDIDYTSQAPFVVVNVRSFDRIDSEIGAIYDNKEWTVHIYYLDISDTYEAGEAKRDMIMSIIEKRLNESERLGAFENIDNEGTREYVYDTSITSGLFDSGGQEDYYSFTDELYLTVSTAKT